MKQKLSNYIAEKLLASGITDVFMITGGGAMHLDDALGHQEGLHCLYNHPQQDCGSVRDDGTWRHQCDERRCGRISGFNPDVCHFRTGAL